MLGTSTSGILSCEDAYRRRDPATGALPPDFDYEHTHDLFSLARFVRAALGLQGPASVLSTACSSAAKAFGEAAELMAAGFCDAAVVGGADSLCGMTLYGFAALELLAQRPVAGRSPPDRDGISIGEAAAFALLERPDAGRRPGRASLRASAPAPMPIICRRRTPRAAAPSARCAEALASAGLAPADIDYVNFHGTGTRANDAAEDAAVSRGPGPAAPSAARPRAGSGHTLGTSGALEAVIAALCIEHGLVPGCLNIDGARPGLPLRDRDSRTSPGPCATSSATRSASAAAIAASILGPAP